MGNDDDTGIVVSPATSSKATIGRVGDAGAGVRRARRLATVAAWMTLSTAVGASAVYLAMRERVAAVSQNLDEAKVVARKASDDVETAKTQIATLTGDLQVARAHLVKTESALATSKLAAEQAIADKAKEAKELEDRLAEVLVGQGQVSQSGGAIRLELVDKVLFAVGKSELTERGKQVLGKVGVALRDARDNQIWVQGHTDDLPITPARGVTPTFPSNWELAATRALTVVHYLQDVSRIEPQRLAAVAFGQYRPISRTRAKNRRIEIVLYPKIDVRPR
jgi:chemotaxis protein MotB